jgi:hypothetical protein
MTHIPNLKEKTMRIYAAYFIAVVALSAVGSAEAASFVPFHMGDSPWPFDALSVQGCALR